MIFIEKRLVLEKKIIQLFLIKLGHQHQFLLFCFLDELLLGNSSSSSLPRIRFLEPVPVPSIPGSPYISSFYIYMMRLVGLHLAFYSHDCTLGLVLRMTALLGLVLRISGSKQLINLAAIYSKLINPITCT